MTLPQQTTCQQEDINDGKNSSAAKFIESLSFSSGSDDSNKLFLHLQPTQYYAYASCRQRETT